MTIAQIKDKAVMVVVYYADCEECVWKGKERNNKTAARQDKQQHNQECH